MKPHYRAVALAASALLLQVLAHPAAAAESVTLTYEAAGLEVPANDGFLRGPETSAADPAQGALTGDGRVDLGRLLLDVPPGASSVALAAVDAAFDRVPVRMQAFEAHGSHAGESVFCLERGREPLAVPVPSGAAVLVLRVLAADLTNACPESSLAGATQGVVTAAFE